MIVSDTKHRPVIDGLILIDCAEPPVECKKYLHFFYIKLLDVLSQFNFSSIVNANTGCQLSCTELSQRNVMEIYSWRYKNPEIQKTARDDLVIVNLIKHAGDNQTSSILDKCLLDNTYSFMINDVDDFEYHCSKHLNDSCKNWLVVGQSWQMCTHNNPMSLTSLRSLIQKNFNFYTIDSGFCKIDGSWVDYEDYANDSLPYEVVQNFGYRLL
jgi:hypothetical protein